MNTNQQAIQALEKNEYEKSKKRFLAALNEERNVQALTNMAWIYLHEEEDVDNASELLKEAVAQQPQSHFPYNLLGEIYVKQEKWALALEMLNQAVHIHPTKAAYHNAAVAHYTLGNTELALSCFAKAAEKSNFAMFSQVKCLIDLGRMEEAKEALAMISAEDEEFLGEVEVADLYIEIGCYEEANKWFRQAWENYFKQPNWVGRYAYVLVKLGDEVGATDRINNSLQEKIEEINETKEEECEENWTEDDKGLMLKTLYAEKQDYESLMGRLVNGYVPPLEFILYPESGCYLFGCTRHQHREYV